MLQGMATQKYWQELSNLHMQVLTEAIKTPKRSYAADH